MSIRWAPKCSAANSQIQCAPSPSTTTGRKWASAGPTSRKRTSVVGGWVQSTTSSAPRRAASARNSGPNSLTGARAATIAGRHKHRWARRRVRVWQSVAHLAAGDLAHFGLVPAVLEAHLHPIYLGHQQLRRRFHWLSCLLSLGDRGRRGALALGQRGTHLLSVGAHGLDPEAN